MHFISIILFAISSNMDNMVVGLSYGIRRIHITWSANLVIGLITLTGTVAAMGAGKSIEAFLPQKAACLAGSLIILFMGAAGLARICFHRLKNRNDSRKDEKAEPEELLPLELKQAFLLGSALTLNNIGLGVGASITGLPVLLTASSSFFFSMILLFWGNQVGKSRLSKLVGGHAEVIANVIMIMLGLYEIFV